MNASTLMTPSKGADDRRHVISQLIAIPGLASVSPFLKKKANAKKMTVA